MAAPSRRLAAIMLTDMVGYSALAQADEAEALRVLERHHRLLRPLFARFRGREIKTTGDGFLVEFESALDAVQCAIEIQRSLHDYNSAAPEEWRIRLRIGLHVGDVVPSDGDVLGDAVNIASRIEPLAEPEGISLSQQVFDQVQNKLPTPMVRLPPRELKNIHVAVPVYRVVRTWMGEGAGAPGLGPAAGRHLAVLPLSNISPDPADAYVAEGLTEELIAVLSQVPDLSVIARTSVTPYKNAQKSIAQVGSELGVDTVLEGSVRKAGNRLRITLQLIDVATQRHIWANSFNREIDDVFELQTDIAGRTAEALRIELARREPSRPGRRLTTNPAAYDLYLRGLVAASDHSERGIASAIRYFEDATRLDPTFAEALAAWANVLVAGAGDFLPMREVVPKARGLVARALELDPDSSDAHAALANIVFQADHDWKRAEEEFRRAIALNPSNVVAHRFFGLMLVALGRFDDAREILRRAIRLDPGGRQGMTAALADLQAGAFEPALRAADEDLAKRPGDFGEHIARAWFYLTAGRRDVAEAEARTPLPPGDYNARYDRGLLKAALGDPEEARAVAAEVERGEAGSYVSGNDLALLYGALGDGARALDLLEREFRDGDSVLWLYYRGVWFDAIRNEPRFLALLRGYGLPTDPPRRAAPAPPR